MRHDEDRRPARRPPRGTAGRTRSAPRCRARPGRRRRTTRHAQRLVHRDRRGRSRGRGAPRPRASASSAERDRRSSRGRARSSSSARSWRTTSPGAAIAMPVDVAVELRVVAELVDAELVRADRARVPAAARARSTSDRGVARGTRSAEPVEHRPVVRWRSRSRPAASGRANASRRCVARVRDRRAQPDAPRDRAASRRAADSVRAAARRPRATSGTRLADERVARAAQPRGRVAVATRAGRTPRRSPAARAR